MQPFQPTAAAAIEAFKKEFSQREVYTKMAEEMADYTAQAWLNMESGEIEYTNLSQGTSLQDDSHLVLIDSFDKNDFFSLGNDDIFDHDSDYYENEDGDIVCLYTDRDDHPEFVERAIEAFLFHSDYDELFEKISERIADWYKENQ